ncbi:MAG: TolC family protein [Spirochaetes bacterium]|nr:TolC family protein [Spirochaetota bacterium]
MKKIIFLILIISAVSLPAQEEKPQTGIIKQNEFMELVLKKAPEIVMEKLSVESDKINVKSASAGDDVSLSAGSSYFGKEYDSTASQSGLSGTNGFNNYASVSKKFSGTGTQLTGTMNYNTSVSEYANGSETELYSPSATVSMRQPLLNNFFGKVDRYSKKSAQTDYEISKLNYSIKEKQVIDYYSALYLEWIIYRRIAAYNAENTEKAAGLYTQTQRKFNARLAENDDLQKAYSSLLANRQSLETSRLKLTEIENEIFNVTGLTDIIPDEKYLDEIYKAADSEKYENVDFSKTLNYRIMNMTLEKLLLSTETSENGTLPDFDIIASLTRKDSDDVNSQAWDFDKTEYTIGFEFSYKFGNNSSEAAYEKAVNSLEIYRETVKQTETDYRISLDDTLKGIQTYKKIIDYQEKNLAALQSALATERKKYAQARITLSNVISTENSIASMRTSILNSKMILVNYYLRYQTLIRQ